jgi:hypothetical protein
MYQPKTLSELARKVIKKNIISVLHLRDLPFPQRFIRDLEETFVEDHLDFEELLSRLTDFNKYYYQPHWKEYLSTSYVTVTPKQLAVLMKYPKKELVDIPFYNYYETLISEWNIYTYAGRTYKICDGRRAYQPNHQNDDRTVRRAQSSQMGQKTRRNSLRIQ